MKLRDIIKPLCLGLSSALLYTSLYSCATTRQYLADPAWKQEKSFNEKTPAGKKTIERISYSFDKPVFDLESRTLNINLKESRYKDTYSITNISNNIREREFNQTIEENLTRKGKGMMYGGIALEITGIIGAILPYIVLDPNNSRYTEKRSNEVVEQQTLGMLAGLATALAGCFLHAFSRSKNNWEQKVIKEEPTDAVRLRALGKETKKEKLEEITLYKDKPAKDATITAESNYFLLNGAKNNTSFLTDTNGKATLSLAPLKGIILTDKELLAILEGYVESGKLSLKEAKDYRNKKSLFGVKLETNISNNKLEIENDTIESKIEGYEVK